MASSGKKKTTMAKINREGRLRERRQEKAARKDARKQAAAAGPAAEDSAMTFLTAPGADVAESPPAA
jgi:hypothetical protein